MNKTKIYSIFVCTGLFISLFTGCLNDVAANKNTEKEDKSYTLSGAILLSDAVPVEISQVFLADNGMDRSAVSSLTIGSQMTLEIKAQSDSTGDKIYQATITDNQYSIALPSAGKWSITASLLCPDNEGNDSADVLNQQFEITIPEDSNDFEISNDIVIQPRYYPNVDGSLRLTLYDDTGKVEKVSYSGEPAKNDLNQEGTNYFETSSDGNFTSTDSGRCVIINKENIAAQVYNVTFKFLDENNRLLYSCVEAISIYSGFTTDTWIGEGAHLIKNGEKIEFRITDELLNSYPQVNLPEKNDGAPIVLWNGTYNGKERKLADDDEGDIFIKEDSEKIYSNGIYVVGNIRDGMELGKTINKFEPSEYSSYTPVFCFDDQAPTNVYLLENGKIKRLKSSYAGYVYDKDVNVDLIRLINEANLNPEGKDVTFFDNLSYYSSSLFFIFRIDETLYLGIYDPSSENFETGVLSLQGNGQEIKSLVVDEIEEKINVCIAYKYTDSAFREQQAIIIFSAADMNAIINGSAASESIPINAEGIGVSFANSEDKVTVSDLYIWDNYLYIAICASPNNSNVFKNSYFKIGDEYIRKQTFISNGGIAKIDLSASTLALENWDKHNTKVLGWYQNIYYDSVGNENSSVTIQPPLSSENTNYFYGPVKFIARKPDELVIADDGGYVDITHDSNKWMIGNCVNKNRVVTVNLQDESMSAVDVNVSFSDTFESGTTYGIFRE